MTNKQMQEASIWAQRGNYISAIHKLLDIIEVQDKRIEALENKVSQMECDSKPLKSKYDIPDPFNY